MVTDHEDNDTPEADGINGAEQHTCSGYSTAYEHRGSYRWS